MKTILSTIIVLLSLITLSGKNLYINKTSYSVYKIDSINNYYLIYAKANDTLYKIISRKEIIVATRKIKIGKRYKFKLHSIWDQDIFINGLNASPRFVPHVTCLGFDSITDICIERPLINDLHYADNVKGLHFIK